MKAERYRVTPVTDGSGNATYYSPNVSGRIHSVSYLKVDFTDGVDFTVTLERTGQSLWTETNINATETVYPVAPANKAADGAASTLSEVPVIAVNDRVKIVIAQGGSAHSGNFDIVVT